MKPRDACRLETGGLDHENRYPETRKLVGFVFHPPRRTVGYGDALMKTAALDIETTGTAPEDRITVIGIDVPMGSCLFLNTDGREYSEAISERLGDEIEQRRVRRRIVQLGCDRLGVDVGLPPGGGEQRPELGGRRNGGAKREHDGDDGYRRVRLRSRGILTLLAPERQPGGETGVKTGGGVDCERGVGRRISAIDALKRPGLDR